MDSFSNLLTESGIIAELITQKENFIKKLFLIIDRCERNIRHNNYSLDKAEEFEKTGIVNFFELHCANYSPISYKSADSKGKINPFKFDPSYTTYSDFSHEGIGRFKIAIAYANNNFTEVIQKIDSLINLTKSDIIEFEKKLNTMWEYIDTASLPDDNSYSFVDDRLSKDLLKGEDASTNYLNVNEVDAVQKNITKLSNFHPELPADLTRVNNRIDEIVRAKNKSQKSYIAGQIAELYNEKYKKVKSIKSKIFFLELIFDSINHQQKNWKRESFISLAKDK